MTDLATLSNGTSSAVPAYGFFDPLKFVLSGMWPSASSGIDVQSTESGYVIEVPVPGFAPDQIEVTYKDGAISISGRHDHRSMMRSFTVPEDIDPEAIKATVENGLLTLTLDRLPHAQPKKIKVSCN